MFGFAPSSDLFNIHVLCKYPKIVKILAVNETCSSFLCRRWKARSHAILSVLKKLQADFFCLQVCSCQLSSFEFLVRNLETLLLMRPNYILVIHWTVSTRQVVNIVTYFSQEVDEYDSFYRKNMESLGYSGIYIQRTGQRKRDGCAIFFKPSWYMIKNTSRVSILVQKP